MYGRNNQEDAIILAFILVGIGFGVWGICVAVAWEDVEIRATSVVYTEEWDEDLVCTTHWIGNISYQTCDWEYDYYRYYTFVTDIGYTYHYTWSKSISYSSYRDQVIPGDVPIYQDGQCLKLSGPNWAWGMDVWFCNIIEC